MLFHIADAGRWHDAQASGEYTASTIGMELADVGFIHLCTDAQVAGVLDRFYRGVPNLVLLHVDESLVASPVVFEHVGDAPEPFPHLYGPLPCAAVTSVEPLPARP